MNVAVSKDGCNATFKHEKMRTWLNGKILLKGPLEAGGDSCQYAVLDTIVKTLTYKRLDANLKWIEKCDDVRAWENDVYCFLPGKQAFEAVLLRNGFDTIDVPIKFTVGDFWGSVLRPNANLCSLIDDKVICSGAVWRGGLTFYEDEKIVVDLK